MLSVYSLSNKVHFTLILFSDFSVWRKGVGCGDLPHFEHYRPVIAILIGSVSIGRRSDVVIARTRLQARAFRGFRVEI